MGKITTLKQLKRKVGNVCRDLHPRYLHQMPYQALSNPCDSTPVHPDIPLFDITCNKPPDMSDMLVQFIDLKSDCGGMAVYAVIFAAEASSHGRDSVDTFVFASDDCLLTRMGL